MYENKTPVVCKTYEEFQRFSNKIPIADIFQYVRIDTAKRIYGFKDCTALMVGDWRQHPELKEIVAYMKSHNIKAIERKLS